MMVLVDEETKSGRAGFCEAGRQEAALQLGLQRRSLELRQRALGSMPRPKAESTIDAALSAQHRCRCWPAPQSPAAQPQRSGLSTRCSRRRSDTLQSTRARSPPSARRHRTQEQAPGCRLCKHGRRAPWAVMKEASSEQRNAIKLATSCGSPSRPRAWRAESVLLSSGLAWSPAVNPVLMNPGPAHRKRPGDQAVQLARLRRCWMHGHPEHKPLASQSQGLRAGGLW